MDWAAWQSAAQVAWDWGGQLGLGGLVGWYLNRWLGDRDKAADRGRSKLAAARPEVVPVASAMNVATRRAIIDLRNRGTGSARDIRVTLTGSAAVGIVREIEAGRAGQTAEMDLSDAPFFRQALAEPAELTVEFKDCFANQYVLRLPVEQEDRGARFDLRLAHGQYQVQEPKLSKKRLREIDGS